MSEDNLLMNTFLMDPEKEVQSHDSISEKNIRALQQLRNNISTLTATSLDSPDSEDMFAKVLRLKKENISKQSAGEKKKAEAIALATAIEKKKKNVANLEKKLKELTEEYEQVKLERQKEEQEDRASVKIFKRALEFYMSYFQYTIEEGIVDEHDKFCVVITFLVEGRSSKYPIRFTFDKQTNSLLSFDAGDLLNEKQLDMLYQRFKESGSYPTLFVTLREAAVRKQK